MESFVISLIDIDVGEKILFIVSFIGTVVAGFERGIPERYQPFLKITLSFINTTICFTNRFDSTHSITIISATLKYFNLTLSKRKKKFNTAGQSLQHRRTKEYQRAPPPARSRSRGLFFHQKQQQQPPRPQRRRRRRTLQTPLSFLPPTRRTHQTQYLRYRSDITRAQTNGPSVARVPSKQAHGCWEGSDRLWHMNFVVFVVFLFRDDKTMIEITGPKNEPMSVSGRCDARATAINSIEYGSSHYLLNSFVYYQLHI